MEKAIEKEDCHGWNPGRSTDREDKTQGAQCHSRTANREGYLASCVVTLQGLYSLSGKTSYCQISRGLEAARLYVIIIVSL